MVSVAAHHLLCATVACGLQYIASDARPSLAPLSFHPLHPSLPRSQPPGPASEPAGWPDAPWIKQAYTERGGEIEVITGDYSVRALLCTGGNMVTHDKAFCDTSVNFTCVLIGLRLFSYSVPFRSVHLRGQHLLLMNCLFSSDSICLFVYSAKCRAFSHVDHVLSIVGRLIKSRLMPCLPRA